MLPYRSDLKTKARRLRRNMTEAEQRLWRHLRRKQLDGVQFYRQKPLGPYIVDFFAATAKLVVEIDGGQHFDAGNFAGDRRRDDWLESRGIRVLRFDNRQTLLETEQVVAEILNALRERMAE